MEMSFHSHATETHFHKKGFALSLILKVTVFGTRRWPIHLTNLGIMNTHVRWPADQFCRINRQNIGVRASQSAWLLLVGGWLRGLLRYSPSTVTGKKNQFLLSKFVSAIIACLFL